MFIGDSAKIRDVLLTKFARLKFCGMCIDYHPQNTKCEYDYDEKEKLDEEKDEKQTPETPEFTIEQMQLLVKIL